MTLLQARDLSARYGASQALFGVSVSVEPGQVVALMGRNGMGKSTTIKVICGWLPALAGRVSLAGQDVTNAPAYQMARRGIGLVPEGRRCFAPLTVRENLTAAARPGDWTLERVTELFPRLGERLAQTAQSLSGGEQQMLAIGRALMTNPSLLILDEATEGLAPVVRQEIWAVIQRLKAETGLALLIVDKSLRDLRRVADRAVILERGRDVWSGQMADLTPETTDRYLGV